METTISRDIGIVSVKNALQWGFSGNVTWSGVAWEFKKTGTLNDSYDHSHLLFL